MHQTPRTSMNLYVEKSFKEKLYEYCNANDLVPSKVIQRVLNDRVLTHFRQK